MRAALFLNGLPPSGRLLENFHADLLICADGAYDYLKNYNTMTDIVLGDFDSFRGILPKNAEILRFPAEKDKTDSELALSEAIRRGADSIDIFGASGGRDDHTLGNFGLLFKAKELGAEARIITDYNIIQAATGPALFCGKSQRGQTISLVPFGGDAHIIQTDGLKYGLIDKTLRYSETLGISNIATRESYSVRIGRGSLLIFTVTNP